MTTCAACGTTSPPRQKFCGECGARLAVGARERKVVTVLFCDLVGSTAAADGRDPEEISAWLAPYHAGCRAVVSRFGGTVEKFIGDAVMAVFGAPVAHEDDPERAVRAGFALLDMVHGLQPPGGARPAARLEVRVGVATGQAMVSTEARPDLGEGMLAGDVVNVAARLQGAAPPGRVLVGRATWEGSRAAVVYDAHEPVRVKGKTAPLSVWLAVAPRGTSGEALADASTPMVGRADELGALERAFARTLRERSVQVVTVVGEAGLGKSRLVEAFAERVDAREELVTWRQGRTPPYGETVAYSALTQVLRAHVGILDSDQREVALERLTATVEAVVAGGPAADQAPWLVARLAALLGLQGDDADRAELAAAAARFLRAVAGLAPTVLVVEDLHWADQAMIEFLEGLRDQPDAVPLLVVCTARPDLTDRAPTWSEPRPNATTLTLGPLSDNEIAQLVTTRLGAEVLPADRHAALLAGAAGNPLYAREYLSYLTLDPDADLSDGAPASVQAVIAARLDTLPAPEKGLLMAAAVLGHTVWTGAVSALTVIEAVDVDDGLADLVARDFLRRSATSRIADQTEYVFAHALIADVALAQVPHADRTRLHEAAAGWHAGRVTDPNASPEAGLVALHYTQAHHWATWSPATDTARVATRTAALSARWHAHAAEGARHRDLVTAVSHAQQAVDLTAAEDPERSSRLLLLGALLWSSGGNELADRVLDEARRTAEQEGLEVVTAHAQVRHASVLVDLGRNAEAATARDAAIVALRQHPPGPELVDAYLQWARDLGFDGDMAAAREAVDQALDVLDLLAEPAVRHRVRAWELRGSQRTWSGDTGGLDDLTRALELAERHLLSTATIGILDELASYHYFASTVDLAIEHDERALAVARQSGHRTWELLLSGGLGELLTMSGRYDEAIAACERAAAVCSDVQHQVGWATLRAAWARALGLTRHPEAGAMTARAIEDARETSSGILAAGLLVGAEHEVASAGGAGPLTAELFDLLADPHVREFEAQYLSRFSRLAPAVDGGDLIRTWLGEYPSGMVLFDVNLLSCRGLLAEADGDDRGAADLHRQAAQAWRDYGCPVEEADAAHAAERCTQRLAHCDRRRATTP